MRMYIKVCACNTIYTRALIIPKIKIIILRMDLSDLKARNSILRVSTFTMFLGYQFLERCGN